MAGSRRSSRVRSPPKRKAPKPALLDLRRSPRNKKAKASEATKSKQSKLTDGRGNDGDLERRNKSAGLIDKDVLLPDTIFEGGAPPELQGRLFHYQVTGYNSIRKEFELTYRNVHIAADGDMWTIDVDAKEEEAASGKPSTINNAKYDLVWEGACLMTRAHIRVAAREDKERKTAEDEVVVMAEVVEDGPIDLRDLQRAAETNTRGWFGEEVINCLFHLTGNTG